METHISDEEVIYRCVFYPKAYSLENGVWRISSMAFADKNSQPSVDRACLRNYNPRSTQVSPDDGVVGLVVGEVRLIKVPQNDSKGNLVQIYEIDVKHRPREENISHSQIEPSPNYSSKNPFRKVRERLAELANLRIQAHGWEVEPPNISQ